MFNALSISVVTAFRAWVRLRHRHDADNLCSEEVHYFGFYTFIFLFTIGRVKHGEELLLSFASYVNYASHMYIV
jgi:hypothetical protein